MRLTAVFAALLGLSACGSLTPVPHPPATEHAPADQRIDIQLNAHTEQIGQLQQQISELRQQIAELQNKQQAAPAADSRPVRGSTATPAAPVPAAAAQNSHDQAYRQARSLYQNGLYRQALHHLSFAERNGSGSQTEQNALFLMMQSHEKLRNCESVIISGQRFATRFAANPKAAEALYSVGSCQWNMQQRDIARDTWRKLMQTYPNSPAARRAHQRIQNNR
ncbi:tetratricopeptide repeat protein [Neisseria shayeganii]|uniref:Tetratricopeptide repeat protein n=1 Tax=Neisseria shayeganii TaxID=607712 RepID=A0A7D7T5X5_9NEIS|nr:tetratricopeptide repeat protein [Neisseria shayeganii]QMT41553.1 tetratricopeptide repeat protein [Neisseria shayeganii]